ncbi:hypothetical protein [Micromonospora chaiyaphumensis]|uniref:hypothetical protein n=1 Tax=Micromonospora chaiyaphumensis TaxID=307119 RepID=UPI0014289FFD|nr:hypothetical protein [Micromonospora chaiyaphumensis]
MSRLCRANSLFQHLAVLENAGLVQIEKRYAGRRGRTWVRPTDVGDTALAEEIAPPALLIARVETTHTLQDW